MGARLGAGDLEASGGADGGEIVSRASPAKAALSGFSCGWRICRQPRDRRARIGRFALLWPIARRAAVMRYASFSPVGDEVDCAESSTVSLQMLHAAVDEGSPYRLAILDCQMPDLGGLNLADRIRSDPQLSALRWF